MALRAGSLRHLLTFERRAAGRNAFGESSGAWELLWQAYGAIEPAVQSQEQFEALQVGAVAGCVIRCRYAPALAGVKVADRIRGNNKTFDVRAVIEVDSAQREMQFIVDEHSE